MKFRLVRGGGFVTLRLGALPIKQLVSVQVQVQVTIYRHSVQKATTLAGNGDGKG